MNINITFRLMDNYSGAEAHTLSHVQDTLYNTVIGD